MNSISFTVPGAPIAKQRHRGVALQQCRKCGRKTARRVCTCGSSDLNYLTTLETTPKETVLFENRVAQFAKLAMEEKQITGPTTYPVVLALCFYFLIPKSRAKKLKHGDLHSQRPDLDNCIKSIEDGMNKVVFADDSQVASISAGKYWSPEPRTQVIASWEGGNV